LQGCCRLFPFLPLFLFLANHRKAIAHGESTSALIPAYCIHGTFASRWQLSQITFNCPLSVPVCRGAIQQTVGECYNRTYPVRPSLASSRDTTMHMTLEPRRGNTTFFHSCEH
jgi:hypothetical protein